MYHVIGTFILIFLYLSSFEKKLKKNHYLLIFIILGLFLFASLRYNIGTDYPVYYKYFNSIKPISSDSIHSIGAHNIEPLFTYFVAVFKHIIMSPIFYFSFCAFITLFFVYKGIKLQSEHYLLSIFIFYCHFYINYQFNGIRQGIVMGLFIYSTKYIIKFCK